jgi:monoamine oxidase
MSEHDVVVVGSGFAGITAARDLRDQGRSVLVLEARDRVGGRTYSRPFAGHDDVLIEAGGAYVNLHAEHNLRRELERYGLSVVPSEGAVERARFVVGGELKEGLPVPPEQLRSIERVLLRMAQDAQRITPSIPLAEQPVDDLDVSIAEYLGRLELPPETHTFLTGLVAGWIQCDAGQTSILPILTYILSCGGSPVDTFFGTFGSTFPGGTRALFDAMIDGSQIQVLLDRRVTQVVQRDGEVTLRTASGESHTAKTCVIAAPTSTWGDIEFQPNLHPDKQKALSHGHYSRGVKKLYIVEGAPRGVFGIGEVAARLQWLFEDRTLPDGRTLLIGFGIDESLADNDLAVAQAVVERYVPEARVVAVDGEDWFGDPLTQGIVGFPPAGQARRFAQTMSRPEGRLAFAGCEVTTSVLFWGWMEGAVESGHAAARQVAKVLTHGAAAS